MRNPAGVDPNQGRPAAPRETTLEAFIQALFKEEFTGKVTLHFFRGLPKVAVKKDRKWALRY